MTTINDSLDQGCTRATLNEHNNGPNHFADHQLPGPTQEEIEESSLRYGLLLMDLLTLNHYESKLEDLFNWIRNRIKQVHEGRRDHLTMKSLKNLEYFYFKRHSICKEVLSEREDSIFGTVPPLEYSDHYKESGIIITSSDTTLNGVEPPTYNSKSHDINEIVS